MSPNLQPDFRDSFARQVSLADEEVDLQRAALYLAGEEFPDLEVERFLQRIHEMAEEVRSAADDPGQSEEKARSLNHYLFDLKGFSGNATDYYNPENSFLNRVMDTGVGIPITLSVLYLGLADRLGLDCYGVGMPGHFLVGIRDLDLYMDPFHSGQLLSAGDCRRLAEQMFGHTMEWDARFLEPSPNKVILLRILNNLRLIYSQSKDSRRLASVLQRMLLVDEANVALYRDLALCQIDMGQSSSAIQSLESLISHSSSDRDIAAARELIKNLARE